MEPVKCPTCDGDGDNEFCETCPVCHGEGHVFVDIICAELAMVYKIVHSDALSIEKIEKLKAFLSTERTL